MIRASVMVLMSSAIFGQAGRFEVASIKPTLAGRPRQVQSCAGGRFTTRGTPIAWILKWSYGLADYQLRDGGPSWLNSFDTYDIEAEAAPPVTETQCRSMVQTLIKERFKLRAHRETIQVSAYALVLGKSGFKLHDRGRVRINGAVKQDLWEAEPPDGWTMSRLGNYLAGVSTIGRPVLDRTGLAGIYGFGLNYSTREGDDRPNVFTAVQEQLGLKLEIVKAPIEMFVIEHVERPSEN
jgi:uncharacterized protein (TIGR03435 family)